MQQPSNMLLAFLQELLQRFFTKSPKFFRIFQLLFGIATAITGLPELLHQFNITLPAYLCVLENKFIAALSLGITIASTLTTQSKVVALKDDGTPVKETNERLPFTAASETKAVSQSSTIKTL